MTSFSREELVARIESFPHWRYPFELGGVQIASTHGKRKTESLDDLRALFWPAMLELCGGSLEGLSVLDVGCNAGYWSLEAVKAGAKRVVGIDVRPVYIEQAKFLRDAIGVEEDRLDYRTCSAYDLRAEDVGTFDVVLLMRVLHHLRHPLLALERVREVCTSYLVADVRLAYKEAIGPDNPALFLRTDTKHGPDGRYEVIQHVEPTRAAFELMLVTAGFSAPAWVVPPSKSDASRSLKAYARGKRAFVTARAWSPER